MRNYRTYMITLLITVIGLSLFSLAASVLVDPYGIHRLVTIEGFNAKKTEADTNIRLVKAYGLKQAKPDTIILGNSRVEDGYDTDLFDQALGVDVYNVGLPGSSIYELYRYLQHAQSIRPLKRIILAVDYFSFNSNQGRFPPTFKEGRLDIQADGAATSRLNGERIEDYNNIYVSLSSLGKAWKTLIKQSRENVSNRTATGFNPMNEADLVYARRGYRKNFFAKDYSQARNIWRRGFNSEASKRWPIAPFEYLEKIIELARDNNIQLDLFIHPYHAHMLEMINALGQWEDFENWKRYLVSLLVADRARNPEGLEFPLWDFSTYNSITNDPLPAFDDNGAGLAWYWDVSHYKSGVGNLVVRRLYDIEEIADETPLPEDFGVKLTLDNLEPFLASYGPARAAYRRSRPAEMAELAKIIETVRALPRARPQD